jgi:hypothetical protein
MRAFFLTLITKDLANSPPPPPQKKNKTKTKITQFFTLDIQNFPKMSQFFWVKKEPNLWKGKKDWLRYIH